MGEGSTRDAGDGRHREDEAAESRVSLLQLRIPMGRTVDIYFNSNDVLALENAARTHLGAVLLGHRHAWGEAAPVESTVIKSADGFRSFGYLVRPQDIQKVVLRYVPTQGYCVVDQTRSPLVELDGGFCDGKILRRGRLYFLEGFYDEAGQWVNKADDLLQWAEETLRLAKKCSRRDQKLQAYIGPAAAEDHRAGSLFVAS